MSGAVRSVVVLGARGFIGTHLVRQLERDHPALELVTSDIADIDLRSEEETARLGDVFTPATAVVMCAGVKRQLGDTLDAFADNIAIVTNVCRVLTEHPVRRFVFFSSAAVYGEETTNLAISEETPVNPTSNYGIAKFASERLLQGVIRPVEGSTLLALRPPLTYGPGDLGFYGPSGFLQSALSDGRITLWGEGDELREFAFVEDVAAAVSQLLLDDYDGVLNPVSGRAHTFRDVVAAVAAVVPGVVVESRPRSRPKADNAFRDELIRSLLPEWRPTPLAEGVRQMLAALEGRSAVAG